MSIIYYVFDEANKEAEVLIGEGKYWQAIELLTDLETGARQEHIDLVNSMDHGLTEEQLARHILQDRNDEAGAIIAIGCGLLMSVLVGCSSMPLIKDTFELSGKNSVFAGVAVGLLALAITTKATLYIQEYFDNSPASNTTREIMPQSTHAVTKNQKSIRP